MPTIIVTTSLTTNGEVYNLTASSNVVVNAGVALASNLADAILSNFPSNSAVVRGSVIGERSGIAFGAGANGLGHSITVAAGGEVGGFQQGIKLNGTGNAIYNSGFVWSDFNSPAILIQTGNLLGTNLIVNRGRIEGQTGIQAVGDDAFTITNSGAIDGLAVAFQHLGYVASDIITNTGSIFGDIYLGAGNDRYDGAKGRLTGLVYGGDGNDTVIGGVDDEILLGESGNDTIRGGGGVDELDGGAGFDTADFSDKTVAVAVTLDGSYFVTVAVGGIEEDTIRNFERIVGGSAGDIMTGDRLANTFAGRGGNDVLDGAAGLDTADYSDKRTAVVVTLAGSADAVVTVGGVAEDTIRNIENIIGGQGNDILVGDGLANVFYGRGGDDALNGGAGLDTAEYSEKTESIVVTLNGATPVTVFVDGVAEDTIVNIEGIGGGAGNDILTGDGLNNVFRGRGGNNIMAGAGGTDTVTYSDQSLGIAVTLNGTNDTTVTVGGVVTDTIRSIENIVGGGGNDQITGDTLSNVLSGGAGNDLLQGAGGNDTLNGDDGNDEILDGGGTRTTINGGAGNDIINLFQSTANIGTIDGGTGNDVLVAPLGVFGSNKDSIAGLTITNVEILATQNLHVLGTVEQFESFNGIFQYNNPASGIVRLELANGGLLDLSAELQFNRLDLIGSDLADTIISGSDADFLRGGIGADSLSGRAGFDTLVGGADADRFIFDTALNAASNVDTINDFSAVDDTIVLENAIFTALTATGTLSAAAFRSNLTGLAEAAGDRIIYETDTGSLRYDADGSGGGASIAFALNANLSAITSADFLVI